MTKRDSDKTKKQLVEELERLRLSLAELERTKAEPPPAQHTPGKSETQYRKLVEDAAAGVAIIDKAPRFVYVNDTLCHMTGYQKEEMYGKHLANFLHHDDKERVISYFRQALAQSKDRPNGEFSIIPEKDLEFRIVHKDGHSLSVYSNPTALRHGDEITQFGTILIDITELRRAEEALRGSEETLRRIFESVADGIIVLDLDGNIIEVSDRALGMSNFNSKDETLGKHIEEFIALSSYSEASDRMRGLLTQGAVRHVEFSALRADGSEFPVEINASVLRNASGNVCGFIIVLRDVTQRKRAEQKAAELELLKRLDQLRTDFLGNVSHELRTPLAAIKGFVSTLLRQDVKWSDEEQRDFLETIDHESDRLTRLISDLLEVSRLESGALELNRSRCLLSDIIDSTRARLARLTERHRLQFLVTSGLPPVFVDEMRIGQVLVNLVENATKYSPEGSRITLEAQLKGDEVIVSVADKGEGIPAELQNKVFDRFYQAASIVSGRKSGTGLGLSVCRGIVEAHGGRIWVQSGEGKGSKFSFSLPVSQEKKKITRSLGSERRVKQRNTGEG